MFSTAKIRTDPPPVPPLVRELLVNLGVIDFIYLNVVDAFKPFSLTTRIHVESESRLELFGTW